MLKTRTWVILFAVLAAVFGILSFLTLRPQAGGTVVQILQDGTVIQEIDLSQVLREETFEIAAPDGGVNVVTVRPGTICVSDADCPDRICVDRGWLSRKDAAPIICMPHRLVLQLKDAPASDGVAQ